MRNSTFYLSCLLAVLMLVLTCVVDAQKQNSVKFGKQLLEQFMIDPNYTNVNHASYGATPKIVFNAKAKYIDEMEWNIDDWMRNKIEYLLQKVREIIAAYISAPSSEQIVFIENASDGYNAVMKSFSWSDKDKVLSSTLS